MWPCCTWTTAYRLILPHLQFNTLMSLASQHSAHAAIHVRAMFLEAAVLLVFLEFLRQIQGENYELGLLPLFLCLLNKMRIFDGGNISVLCSGISVGWMFTLVGSGCEAINNAWRAELHLNMSTYPQRNSSG